MQRNRWLFKVVYIVFGLYLMNVVSETYRLIFDGSIGSTVNVNIQLMN